VSERERLAEFSRSLLQTQACVRKKERRESAKRKEEMQEASHRKGVLAFALKALVEQLAHIGAEVAKFVCWFVRQEEESRKALMESTRALVEREHTLRRELEGVKQELEDSRRHCDSLIQEQVQTLNRMSQQHALDMSQLRGTLELDNKQLKLRVEDLQHSLDVAQRAYEDSIKQIDIVKQDATVELMRLLSILSMMQKQQQEMVHTSQFCGVGLILEPRCFQHSPSADLHQQNKRISPGHASSTDRHDAVSNLFLVREVVEGFSAALNGIQKGDRVLSIDGVDLSGKTESAVHTMLRGPRGSTVHLLCARGTGSGIKTWSVRLQRGKLETVYTRYPAARTEEADVNIESWTSHVVHQFGAATRSPNR
jgi:hypothetical protein